MDLSLGIIETVGLAAAVEAADACVKSANVELVGYELTRGSGMVLIKIEGNVGAVKAAIDAAKVSAAKVGKVAGAHVIPRPSRQIDLLIRSGETVGLEKGPEASPPEAVEPETPEVADTAEEAEEGKKPDAAEGAERAENIEENGNITEAEAAEETEAPEEAAETEVSEENDTALSSGGKDEFNESVLTDEPHGEIKKDEIKDNKEESAEPKHEEAYTCNICKDPKCTRKKGDLKNKCIHYKNY